MSAWLLGPAPAPAPAGWKLAWAAPEGCPSATEVERRIADRLGPDPTDTSWPLSITADVQVVGGKFETSVRLRSGSGERTQQVVTDECETAANAVVLMATVAIAGGPVAPPPEPPAVVAEPPPASNDPQSEDVTPPDEENEPVEPEAKPAPANRTRRRVRPTRRELLRPAGVAIRGGGGIEAGALPPVGGGGSLGVALLWRRARLELGGTVWAPPVQRTETIRTRFLLGVATIRGCYTPRVARVEFPICGGLEAGGMRGVATGIAEPEIVLLPWAAIGAGAGLVWFPGQQRPNPRVGLWLEGAAAASLTRPRFFVEGRGNVYQASQISGRVMGGVEIRFLAMKSGQPGH